MKYTDIKLRTLEDKDLILTLENKIRGGISSVMGDRYVKSNENKKVLYIDGNKLYGWAMSENLPYDEIKFDKNVKLEDISNTPDDSDIGYSIEADLKYSDNINKKPKNFQVAIGNGKNNPDHFKDYMKKKYLIHIHKLKKSICDWSDKNCLINSRMLNF